uniref:RNA-directed DNA polymerase, eukaryota, reverse transcriptase zinc-binding domain protein n=1 Tax=Tanacetum cinerariifolium TaxID=118510 RepID=A0A6L2JEQ0_TANCI|nr:hypothetical protein [Tanacetum cinerariifolium]
MFLPYGISDHSPAILILPQAMKKKNKSFRLANYVTDKEEFKKLVKGKWHVDIPDHAMSSLRAEGIEVLKEYTKATINEEKLLRQKAGFLGINPIVTSLNEEDSCLFEKKVFDKEVILMITKDTDDEIKKPLYDIDNNKAPRPNKFTSKFYKKAWNIIKDDLCATIKEFFMTEKLL